MADVCMIMALFAYSFGDNSRDFRNSVTWGKLVVSFLIYNVIDGDGEGDKTTDSFPWWGVFQNIVVVTTIETIDKEIKDIN